MALNPSIERRVRNLIPDTDAIFGDAGDQYLFSSDSIEDFYADGNGSIKWAAGLAKKTVGASEALILKVIKNYETATDGASLMKQWEAAGQALIDEGKSELGWDAFDSFEVFYTGSDNEDAIAEGTSGGYPIWRSAWV